MRGVRLDFVVNCTHQVRCADVRFLCRPLRAVSGLPGNRRVRPVACHLSERDRLPYSLHAGSLPLVGGISMALTAPCAHLFWELPRPHGSGIDVWVSVAPGLAGLTLDPCGLSVKHLSLATRCAWSSVRQRSWLLFHRPYHARCCGTRCARYPRWPMRVSGYRPAECCFAKP